MDIYVRFGAIIQYYHNKDILKRDLFKLIGQDGPVPFVSWLSKDTVGGAKCLGIMYTFKTKMLRITRKKFDRDNDRENADILPCSRGLSPLFLL